LIDDHIEYAIGVLFDLQEAQEILHRQWRERFNSVYAACCQLAMLMCGRWSDQHGHTDPIAYFFESGHKDQGNADQGLHAIKCDSYAKAATHYHAHRFLDKRLTAPLQAADVWVWLALKHFVECRDGLPTTDAIEWLLSRPRGDRYDLRPFVGTERVQRLFDETFYQPWRSEKARRAYDKRLRNLRNRGDI
jgi:hypothetical protein